MKKKNKKICYLCICTYILMLLFSTVYGMPDFAVVEVNGSKYKTAESSIQTSNAPVFNFQSASQLLMEATTGEILYANNENEKLLPASVTKIMTMLLIMEKIDSGALKYTDTITCSSDASGMGGSQIWFKEGETLTVDEALKCIAVVSANDVSVAMAEHIGGSHENFVKMMNDKAKEIGMDNTNFMNAHGIDEDGHYTTAKDIAIMSRELITKHPDILKYTTIWMDSIRNGEFALSSTNKLLKSYEGITGLKTGSTSQALFNLSATAVRDNLSLIAVVLKAPTSDVRNLEITTLLNYGFSTYSSTILGKKGDIITTIDINKNISKKVEAVLENTEAVVCKKGENTEYTKLIELDKNISAPLNAGDAVGKVKFMDSNNNIIKETNLIITENIAKSNLWEYITKIVRIYSISGLKTV